MKGNHRQNWPTKSTYGGIIRQGFETNHKKYIKASRRKGRSHAQIGNMSTERTHAEMYVYMEALDIFFFNLAAELSLSMSLSIHWDNKQSVKFK